MLYILYGGIGNPSSPSSLPLPCYLGSPEQGSAPEPGSEPCHYQQLRYLQTAQRDPAEGDEVHRGGQGNQGQSKKQNGSNLCPFPYNNL